MKCRTNLPILFVSISIQAFYQNGFAFQLLANESEEEGGESAPEDQTRRVNATSADGLTHMANGNGNRAACHNAMIGRDYKRLFSIGTVPVEQGENKTLGTAIAFVVRHSYALALVMMMAWAITYHSWLAFIWLALACIIWMMADSRRACFVLSPFIVVYAEVSF